MWFPKMSVSELVSTLQYANASTPWGRVAVVGLMNIPEGPSEVTRPRDSRTISTVGACGMISTLGESFESESLCEAAGQRGLESVEKIPRPMNTATFNRLPNI